MGEIPLSIPMLREGTCFPSLLEPRKRSEKALLAVVQTAYVQGVSTRKVDNLLRAAARGEAASEWHALFDAINEDAPLDQAAGRLIRRGHTSGADALAGFLAFFRAMRPLAEQEV